MGKGIAGLEQAYGIFFTIVLIFLAILVVLCLIRAIIGPRVADRIVAANMMGTMVIVMIAVLAVMLGEGYLVDICIIYAMISFLAVIVLTKVYMGVYVEKKEAEKLAAGEAEIPAKERKTDMPEALAKENVTNVSESLAKGEMTDVSGTRVKERESGMPESR